MTSISQNTCIGTLDDMIDDYDNTYYWTIERKPIVVKRVHIWTLV